MTRLAAALIALGLLFAAPVAARQPRLGDLRLDTLHVRASIGATPNTAGYVTVVNVGPRPDRLVTASCACARRVELHATSTDGGVARMGAVRGFDVPARGRLTLAPGGGHLMLLGLTRPIRDGEFVRITLRFERAGMVAADFHVMARIATTPAAGHAHH